MKAYVLFLGLCVALTAVLAAPSQNGQGIKSSKLSSVRHLGKIAPRGYFSEIIQETLHMTVKELLLKIEKTFKDLDTVTEEALDKLNGLLASADPDVREELIAIREQVMDDVFEKIGALLADLGIVLPGISGQLTRPKKDWVDPVEDLIFALLGITLEELVTKFADAMDRLLETLTSTITNLKELAAESNSSVGTALIEIADNYLSQGRVVVIPMLDQLRLLVNPERQHIIHST